MEELPPNCRLKNQEWLHEGLPTRLSRELGYMMGRGGTPQAFLVVVGRHILLLNMRLNKAHIRALASSVPKYLAHHQKTYYMRCSKCQIIWHEWTIPFQIWNGTVTNAIMKNYFFLSPLVSYLSSLSFFFFFLLQTCLSFLSLSPLTHFSLSLSLSLSLS